MKVHLVRIGTSKGIRIPKFVIEQCQLHGAVDLIVQQGQLLVRSATKARAGGTKPSNKCIAMEMTVTPRHAYLPSAEGD